LSEARTLLKTLGALDSNARITKIGRKMVNLPLHPRLANIVLEGDSLGEAGVACDLAALLSERDIFRRENLTARPRSGCDYSDRLEALDEWRSGSGFSRTLDLNACRQLDRVAARLKKVFDLSNSVHSYSLDSIPLLLMKGFPDRIGIQREKGSDRYLLANGTGAKLGPGSALHDDQFIVAVEVLGVPGKEGAIHGASAVTFDQIRSQFPDHITIERRTIWDREGGKILTSVEEKFGAIQLSLRNVTPEPEEIVVALIEAISDYPDLDILPWTIAARQLQARADFISRVSPERGLPDISNAKLSGTLSEWLTPAIYGIKSASDLKRLNMFDLIQSLFSWEQLRFLDEGAPTHITVPSGSRLRLDYTNHEPFVSVKLQEMFGLAETPRIAWGRVQLIVYLLSPAQRPIQVTKDLGSFWESTYPQVKKELKGRYPKHPWPDDPWSAMPTRKTTQAGKREK
jgi:ATP-dependent helicase HrpB